MGKAPNVERRMGTGTHGKPVSKMRAWAPSVHRQIRVAVPAKFPKRSCTARARMLGSRQCSEGVRVCVCARAARQMRLTVVPVSTRCDAAVAQPHRKTDLDGPIMRNNLVAHVAVPKVELGQVAQQVLVHNLELARERAPSG